MGVAGVLKEVKLSCSKCHLRLFTTVANDEAGHFPVPFDITPFSFTPTMTSRTHKQDWIPFAICTSPTIHLVRSPNIYDTHCLQFLLGRLQYPEEIKNKSYTKFGGQTRCITQKICKWQMPFSKGGVYLNAFTK